MKSAAQTLRCERHGASAGWECTVCNAPLCPDCAAVKWIPPVSLLVCGRCGELVEPLLRKKSESASLRERLPGAFTFPFRGEGLPAWLGVSMFLWAFSFLGPLGAVVAWSVTIASLFGLTRSTARGGEHLELSDFQDPLQSIAMPLVRFALVTLPAWGGLLLSGFLNLPWLTWVALGLSALWSPTAFIGAAAGARLLDMLNPVRVLGATSRIGNDFGVYLAGILAVGLTMMLSVPLAWLLNTHLVVPVLGGVLVQMVLAYAPFVGARLAGLVLMLHGPVFGWDDEGALYEPVLGETVPRGALPVRGSTLPSSIELEPEVMAERPPASPGDRFAAIEVNPEAGAPPHVASLDAALLPSFSEQSAVSIRQAMSEGKADVALDGFRSTGLSAAEQLTFDELVWLGQTATSQIDYESAELAFRKASERPAPAEALGRARVMFARLLAERLNRKNDATLLMERVLVEQPGTPAATYAQTWLSEQRR